MIPHMQIDFKKYNADGIGSLHDFTQGSLLSSATLGWQKYNTDGVGSCAPFSQQTNKQNHPRAIHPNEINRPRVIQPNETVGAAPVCPPERPRSGVSIPKIHTLCAGMNDGCALAGRRGRAHRRRPYQSPPYFATQFHTKKITIYTQSSQTISTVHTQSSQTTSTVHAQSI